MEQEGIERLEAKSPEEAVIEQIAQDFNLAPFMARTQFEQMGQYFERYLGIGRIGLCRSSRRSAAAPSCKQPTVF